MKKQELRLAPTIQRGRSDEVRQPIQVGDLVVYDTEGNELWRHATMVTVFPGDAIQWTLRVDQV